MKRSKKILLLLLLSGMSSVCAFAATAPSAVSPAHTPHSVAAKECRVSSSPVVREGRTALAMPLHEKSADLKADAGLPEKINAAEKKQTRSTSPDPAERKRIHKILRIVGLGVFLPLVLMYGLAWLVISSMNGTLFG